MCPEIQVLNGRPLFDTVWNTVLKENRAPFWLAHVNWKGPYFLYLISLIKLVALVEEGINYFNQLDRSPARNDLTPAEYWNEAV